MGEDGAHGLVLLPVRRDVPPGAGRHRIFVMVARHEMRHGSGVSEARSQTARDRSAAAPATAQHRGLPELTSTTYVVTGSGHTR